MSKKLNLSNSLKFGGILLVVGLIIGYFIFARTRAGNELISIPALLGISGGFLKNLGNEIRGEYLTQVRIKMLVTGLAGFGVGFFIGIIKK